MASRGLAGLGLTLVAAPAAALLAQRAWDLVGSVGLWRVDDVVALCVVMLGAVLAGWYACTGAALVLAAATRRGLGISRWGAPVARRLAVGLATAAVGVGIIPGAAWAAVPDDLTLGGVMEVNVTPAEVPTELAVDGVPAPGGESEPGPEPESAAEPEPEPVAESEPG
ncbi:MAG: hypothetical protein Q4G64_09420, partial [bacterium]|nr:hypothetical protein [bacterium]